MLDTKIDFGSYGSVDAERRISAYFGHSYRAKDRAINRLVHDLCWDHGFALAVDPWSGPIRTARLEMMMRHSPCFIAVVTRRDEHPGCLCSPFIVHEYSLALRANTRRLVILEKHVAGSYFPEPHNTVIFDERKPAASRPSIEAALARLAAESRPFIDLDDHALGPAGLVLPRTPEYRRVAPTIKQILHDAGFTPRDLDLGGLGHAAVARLMRQLDLVVVDLADTRQPLLAYIEGLPVPKVKLVHQHPDRPAVKISHLLADELLESVATASELAIWWSDPRVLAERLTAEMEALRTPRLEFQDKAEGQAYIGSLGQARGPVFISSANADGALAHNLVERLRSYNLRPFHYQYANTIIPGTDWIQSLPAKIEESAVFLALISRQYWESKHCREEFELASRLHEAGRLKLIPCILERIGGPQIGIQGIALDAAEPAEHVERIVHYLDLELIVEGDRGRGPATVPLGAHDQTAPPVDIVIMTALAEEYDAVYQHLDDPQRVVGTDLLPNEYSWVIGTVTSDSHATYRVLLALGGIGTETALLAAKNTVDAFRPDTVLLVGIAGAVDEQLREGDAVVADRIVGYESGRIRNGFHPRQNLSFPTDQSVAAAAHTMFTRHPDWAQSILAQPPHDLDRPARVLIGPVASGNKVVDDLTDHAFAPVLAMWPKLVAVEMEAIGAVQAVEDTRQRGWVSHFSMIRGISDRPISRADAGATPPSDADQTKHRHAWRKYAAAVAAAFAIRLIQTSWPRRPTTMGTTRPDGATSQAHADEAAPKVPNARLQVARTKVPNR